VLDELGGLDEGYHHHCEDIDLAYRARRAGWERWYVPEPTGAASPASSASTPRACERSSVHAMSAEHPLPPVELMQRVGRIDDADVATAYDAIGRESRERIERLLPDDWSWEGKRVLDFGCGAGRTLRHFLAEAEQAQFHGCDIDAKSIEWMTDHLVPPFHVFQSHEQPGLPRPDGFFDLVYALSVFTHLTDHWAGWLLELHRVLKPQGLLFATFLNEPMWAEFGRGPWDEDRTGMLVTKKWNPWDSGGPIVFHSEWWIREHWGRAFEVLHLERAQPGPGEAQGAMLLRPRPVEVSFAALEQSADDPRELAALATSVEQLHAEAAELYAHVQAVTASHQELAAELERVQGQVETLEAELASISNSNSWRLTRPLREGLALLRRAKR
jgi:SAM-dependent methyltransferase